MFDVSTPESPRFVQYLNHRDFNGDAEPGTAGDLGPEGLAVIPCWESPTRKPLLLVANEVRGTTTAHEIGVLPALANQGGSAQLLSHGVQAAHAVCAFFFLRNPDHWKGGEQRHYLPFGFGDNRIDSFLMRGQSFHPERPGLSTSTGQADSQDPEHDNRISFAGVVVASEEGSSSVHSNCTLCPTNPQGNVIENLRTSSAMRRFPSSLDNAAPTASADGLVMGSNIWNSDSETRRADGRQAEIEGSRRVCKNQNLTSVTNV